MRSDAPGSGLNEEAGWALLLLGFVAAVAVAMQAWFLATWLTTGRWTFGRFTPLHAVTVTGGLLLLVLVAVLVGRAVARRVRRGTHVDRKANDMGHPGQLSRETAAKAADIGRMMWDETAEPGLTYGVAVKDDTPLYMNWRETAFVEAGMGAGKSSAVIIPLVDQAPGNCVTTGMKRDLPDGIRLLCERRGSFYCFDPMPICDYGDPSWWWNPLSDVDGPVTALRLATIFGDATTPADSTKHPFFDTKGPELLSFLILAAAELDAQIDQVYLWAQDPTDDYPVRVLERRFRLPAANLRGIYEMHGESKGDLFATAGKAIGWMTDPSILRWITDTQGRPEFRPSEFVKPYTVGRDGVRRIKRDTLVLMSRKGDGSASPVTAALAASVLKAAQREAARWPHGRLPVPLVMPMDELPNTAPIPSLPDDYTVLGSHGITPIICVQNFDQAIRAWKHTGAQQLWGASTTRVFGPGGANADRLAAVSRLIGQRWEQRQSTSYARGVTTTQVSQERAPIMDVDELGALGEGRFVAIPSGGYAVLGRFVPWWDRPDLAYKVRASLARYEPKGAVA